MKISLSEKELFHLVDVLQTDLKERSKNIRRVNFDTSEMLVESRITAYNRTKDLLQRMEKWHEEEKRIIQSPADDIGDDIDFSL